MVPFHTKRDALSWFKWIHQNNLLTDWLSFSHALELRFDPSSYTNHQVELFKLQQQSSVSEYKARFEKICNCVRGFPPKNHFELFHLRPPSRDPTGTCYSKSLLYFPGYWPCQTHRGQNRVLQT